MSNRLPSLTKIAPKMKGMPGWARRLDRFALSKGVARIPKDIPIDDAEVAKLESSKSKASEAKAGSKVVIPRFYVERKRAKKNRNSEKDFGGESSSSGSSGGHDNTNLQEKIMAVARVDYAKRALKVQATEKDLEMFHGAIKAFSMQRGSPPGWLDYDDYCELKLRAPSRLVPALTTSLFLRLPKDNNGLVKVDAVLYYLSRLREMKAGYLSLLAATKGSEAGSISGDDLRLWLHEEAKKMHEVKTKNIMLAKIYAQTSTRKLLFFLDPHRTGYISVRRLISSSHFTHFQQVQERQRVDEMAREYQVGSFNSDMTRWFEPKTSLKLYGVFLKMDSRNKGSLTESDFRLWNKNGVWSRGPLTTQFVRNLWQVLDMPVGSSGTKEMDFDTYLEFAVAISHLHTIEGMRYMWRVLDIERFGFLARFHIRGLMDSVMDRIRDHGKRFIEKKAGNVQEIFDMTRPKDAGKIELKDLISSQQGGLIISIMIDAQRFWAHEHREHILAGQNP